jgi:hypothetical protein
MELLFILPGSFANIWMYLLAIGIFYGGFVIIWKLMIYFTIKDAETPEETFKKMKASSDVDEQDLNKYLAQKLKKGKFKKISLKK